MVAAQRLVDSVTIIDSVTTWAEAGQVLRVVPVAIEGLPVVSVFTSRSVFRGLCRDSVWVVVVQRVDTATVVPVRQCRVRGWHPRAMYGTAAVRRGVWIEIGRVTSADSSLGPAFLSSYRNHEGLAERSRRERWLWNLKPLLTFPEAGERAASP